MANPGAKTGAIFTAVLLAVTIAHALLVKNLPIPAYLHDWLSGLWLIPVLYLIDAVFDKQLEKWLMIGAIALWFVGCSVTSLPKIRAAFDAGFQQESPQGQMIEKVAEKRSATSVGVDAASKLEPPVLVARTTVLERTREAENIFAKQIDDRYSDLNTRFKAKKINPQQALKERAKIEEDLNAWKIAHEPAMQGVSSNVQGRGIFNTLLWVLALVTMGFTWFTQHKMTNLPGKLAIWLGGVGISLLLIGSALSGYLENININLSGLSGSQWTMLYIGAVGVAGLGLAVKMMIKKKEH